MAARQRASWDPEIGTMMKVERILRELPPSVRQRVLRWLVDRSQDDKTCIGVMQETGPTIKDMVIDRSVAKIGQDLGLTVCNTEFPRKVTTADAATAMEMLSGPGPSPRFTE